MLQGDACDVRRWAWTPIVKTNDTPQIWARALKELSDQLPWHKRQQVWFEHRLPISSLVEVQPLPSASILFTQVKHPYITEMVVSWVRMRMQQVWWRLILSHPMPSREEKEYGSTTWRQILHGGYGVGGGFGRGAQRIGSRDTMMLNVTCPNTLRHLQPVVLICPRTRPIQQLKRSQKLIQKSLKDYFKAFHNI